MMLEQFLQYKREVAAKNGINLKPVILFKTLGRIEQSEDNKSGFHQLLDDLTNVSSINSQSNVSPT